MVLGERVSPAGQAQGQAGEQQQTILSSPDTPASNAAPGDKLAGDWKISLIWKCCCCTPHMAGSRCPPPKKQNLPGGSREEQQTLIASGLAVHWCGSLCGHGPPNRVMQPGEAVSSDSTGKEKKYLSVPHHCFLLQHSHTFYNTQESS